MQGVPGASSRRRLRTTSPLGRRISLQSALARTKVPASVLLSPTNPATKCVAGSSYSSWGVPTCSTAPWFMTAIRSDMVRASS